MSITADLLSLGSAMLHEARGRRGAIGMAIATRWPRATLCGPAYTVLARPGDNLAAHTALENCQPGEVLCISAPPAGAHFGAWGEVLARYAVARGVAGLLTTTGVRDIDQIAELGFPVFSASQAIQGTIKADPGRHQIPVAIGAAIVRPGDWIIGDADGVTVVPAADLRPCLEAARRKVANEERAFVAIDEGRSTREALGFTSRDLATSIARIF